MSPNKPQFKPIQTTRTRYSLGLTPNTRTLSLPNAHWFLSLDPTKSSTTPAPLPPLTSRATPSHMRQFHDPFPECSLRGGKERYIVGGSINPQIPPLFLFFLSCRPSHDSGVRTRAMWREKQGAQRRKSSIESSDQATKISPFFLFFPLASSRASHSTAGLESEADLLVLDQARRYLARATIALRPI